MKRQFIAILMALCAFTVSYAQKKELIIHPSTKPTNQGTGEHSSRSPMLLPKAYLDGHLLTFDFSCIGSTVCILQDDVIVYITIIDENGEVELPDYLIGIFELQFMRGEITFVGEIELS